MLPELVSCLLVSCFMIYYALLISCSLLSKVKYFVASPYCSGLSIHKLENKISISFLLQFYIPKNKHLNILSPEYQAHAHILLISHINQDTASDAVDFYQQKVIKLINYLIDEIVSFLDLIDIYAIPFYKVPFSSCVKH